MGKKLQYHFYWKIFVWRLTVFCTHTHTHRQNVFVPQYTQLRIKMIRIQCIFDHVILSLSLSFLESFRISRICHSECDYIIYSSSSSPLMMMAYLYLPQCMCNVFFSMNELFQTFWFFSRFVLFSILFHDNMNGQNMESMEFESKEYCLSVCVCNEKYMRDVDHFGHFTTLYIIQ